METYKENLRVRTSETDIHKRIKASAVMSWAQEVANNDASLRGYGFNDLLPQQLVWIVSRFRARIHRSPQWQDELSIETWHKGQDGILSLRDYDICDQDGAKCISSSSSWLILHFGNRKIQRFDHAFPQAADWVLHKDALKEYPEKLLPPENLKLQKKHKVRYSDMDFNGHVNNAKYLEWAEDCLYEALGALEIKEFQINLNAESHCPDEIELHTAFSDETNQNGTSLQKTFYVEGRKEGKNIFRSLFVI